MAEFTQDDAHSLAALRLRKPRIGSKISSSIPESFSPSFPAVAANEEQAARIRSGQSVNLPELSRARQVKVFQGQRDLIAIATRIAGTLFHPGIVFVSQEQPTPAAK